MSDSISLVLYRQLMPAQNTRERRDFTRAILVLFGRFKKHGGYDTIIKGVSLGMCLALSKPSLAGNAASISDAAIDRTISIIALSICPINPRGDQGTIRLSRAVY